MSTKVDRKFAFLRQADLKGWTTTLWIVKRRLAHQEASYTVLRADLDKKLEKKLKGGIARRIQDKKFVLEEYEFLSSDQDNKIFTIDSAETDFQKIQDEIDKGIDNGKVEKFEDFENSWAYVVKLTLGGNSVYALRKISKYTKAAKLASGGALSHLLFKNKQLSDLDDAEILTFDTGVDFFSYDGTTFITNKREFESALNFRKGMEKNRDAVLAEMKSLKIFSDIEPIRECVGANLHLLRKISSIQKAKYYKDKDFMAKLIAENKARGWGLKIKNGVIVVDENSVELLLKFLNNERVESQINHEVFDAVVKKKVG